MVAPLIAAVAIPLLKDLAASGLGLLADAVKAKGKDVIEEKLGVDLDKAMQTEEGRIKLQELQVHHEEFLLDASIRHQELLLRQQEMELADTKSARDMQIEALRQNDVFAKRFIYWLTIVWSTFAMAYIGWITFGDIPPDNIRFADTILGFLLGTVIASMLNFFYGSSRGSKDKDDMTKALIARIGKDDAS
jgi:hypothetical protein